jgi:hypothetical protein
LRGVGSAAGRTLERARSIHSSGKCVEYHSPKKKKRRHLSRNHPSMTIMMMQDARPRSINSSASLEYTRLKNVNISKKSSIDDVKPWTERTPECISFAQSIHPSVTLKSHGKFPSITPMMPIC